jgi:hypothetical protein
VPGVEPSCDGRVRRRHDWERDGFITVQMHMKSTAPLPTQPASRSLTSRRKRPTDYRWTPLSASASGTSLGATK